jgi:hypothetical protein
VAHGTCSAPGKPVERDRILVEEDQVEVYDTSPNSFTARDPLTSNASEDSRRTRA